MTAPKVPLDGLANAMPVTAGGYTFQGRLRHGKKEPFLVNFKCLSFK